jgi:type IV pilus assembly protein PilY1
MKPFGRNRFILAVCLLSLFFSAFFLFRQQAEAVISTAGMQNYCIVPPFVSQSVPPLVMLEAGRDHKFYYQAYNDAFDLDEDGKLDRTYKHTIEYYGYFDPHKCYTYSSSGSGQFTPVSVTTDKFCSSGQWSGNVLNWITMVRMDVLKKVLYGGDRVTDTAGSSGQTVLQRAIIPGDAHSSGKELTGRLCYNGSDYTYACTRDTDCDSSSGETCENKSLNLIGIAAATAPHDCSVTAAITWTTQNADTSGNGGKVRISRYLHSSSLSSDEECGADTVTPDNPVVKHNNLMMSFAPETASNFIDTYLVNSFDDTTLDPNYSGGHYDNYNILAVADFNVSTTGNWQFLIDSDDPAELEIGVAPSTATGAYSGGSLVATYYGCHADCFNVASGAVPPNTPTLCDANQLGTINFGATGWYRLIVRQSEKTGVDGVKVWYRKGTSGAWTIFPKNVRIKTGSSTVNITRTPDVATGSECIIESNQYVQYGMPQLGVAGKQHLFCNTQLSATGMPTLRMVQDSQYRIWQWASKENPVCQSTVQQGTSEVSMDGTIDDKTVRVEVCKSSVGLESNCRAYKDNSSPVVTTYKPAGLLQRYGEGDSTKVCSKSYTKTCTSDTDCNAANNGGVFQGFCIDKAQMYFGLISTSYLKNTSGGVLRKNFNSISDEINKYGSTNLLNGTFNTSATNGIINTFENFSGTVGYVFSNHNYDPTTSTTPTSTTEGACGWIINGPLTEGKCREWGNPIGEMMYEGLRYIAGAGSASTAFNVTTSTDSNLSLPHPAWGYTVGGTTYQPYQVMPACSRPFMMLLSDEYTSYDDDQLPGSSFVTVGSDSALPHLNVSTLADAIGTGEGIAGHNWLIGKSGSTNDFICSSKAVTNLSTIEGLCPMEPTKRGSYYSSAVAYYGRTKLKDDTTKPNASTYAVALTSPLANLRIKAGSNIVSIVPLGKTISGGDGTATPCTSPYYCCYNKCTTGGVTADANGLHLGTCSSDAFCATNQIVNLYVDDIRYDSSNNVIYASYRINFEDVEQGADHDMDSVIHYEICTATAVTNGYGSCGTDSIGSGQIEVKVSSVYGKGGYDQVLGFVISGTTADGTYLVIKDGDVPNSAVTNKTPAVIAGLPLSWSKTFTTTGASTNILKSPLWYAAKWGGFDDLDGDGKPFIDSTCGTSSPNAKCAEWDKDGDGVPDNYFEVENPLKLEQQLDNALLSILRRASSGTAASVLASGEGSGANLVQAIFYPKRLFGSKEISWTGSLQNLWYYVDPRLQYSTIREDTPQGSSPPDKELKIDEDDIVQLFFDTADQKTKANRFLGNADGTEGAQQTTVPIEQLSYLWEAGSLLQSRTSSRNIKTSLDGTTLINFDTSQSTNTTMQTLLQTSSPADASNIIQYVRGESDIDTTLYRNRSVTNGSTTGIWRLGDIVSSTPKVVSWINLGNYYKTYKDQTYQDFLNSDAYKYRGKVVSGTAYGTGMVFTGANDGMLHAFKLGALEVVNDNSTKKASLSNSATATMGQEAWAFIPKNALPYLKYLMDQNYCHLYYIDATPVIFDASIGDSSVTGSYWDVTRTVNSWRTILIGSMRFGGACKATSTTNGVQTPISGVGYSSYFALDITDPTTPTLLWEFARSSDNDLGFSTTGPAIVRINARDAGSTDSSANKNKNGRWFAVIASGPTGPITNLEFKGFSNQNLKLFILDLKTGVPLRTMTMDGSSGMPNIPNAFGGSLSNANIDYDLDYQDDAIYMGYTASEDASPSSTTKWTNGGVIRIITNEDLKGTDVSVTGTTALNPANWTVSPLTPVSLTANFGPVSSAVSHLAHYPSNNASMPDKAWLYFGTGRYYYRADDISTTTRRIFSVLEPCLSRITDINHYGDTCSTVALGSSSSNSIGTLANASTTVPTTEPAGGWYITLDTSERVITDPLASTTGSVFFTTFTPSSDICDYGGSTYLWGVKYNTGGSLKNSLKGKAILQVSTGVIEEVNLKNQFTDKVATNETTGRRTASMQGVPPSGQGLSIVGQPPPAKKVIHIRER